MTVLKSVASRATVTEEGLRDITFFAIVPLVTMLLASILADIALRPVVDEESVRDVLTIGTGAVVGLVALPLLYLRKGEPDLRPSDIGLTFPGWRQSAGLALLVGVSLAVRWGAGGEGLLQLALETLFIAVGEEIWARGILFHVLEKHVHSTAVVILLSAAAFGFLAHASNPFLSNLVLRFPFGLVLGALYARTRSLCWPMGLHFIWNTCIATLR